MEEEWFFVVSHFQNQKKRGDFLTLADSRSTEFRVLHFHFSCVICHKPKTEPLANLERCCLFTKSCWTLVNQAPLSMVFPRQEYWNGLPFPSQGALPHPGIKSMSPAWQANSLPLSHQGSPSRCLYILFHGVKYQMSTSTPKSVLLNF